MAPTLLPLNIVTPSGSKSRAYAPPNASLADLRSILVKDAIIKPSTKFHVDGVVISGSAEVHMQWTEVIREIHVCDGEAPSVHHAFNANLNVSGNSSRPQPYPSPSHTPALDEPKELAHIPSFIERPVDHTAHDSVCEGDLKPDCEDSRDCEGSDESSLCSSPTTCQAPCDPPKDCAAEGPHRPCDQDSSVENCAQAEPCSARGDPAAIEACQEEQDGDQQECEPYSDRPCESPNVAEGDLENDEYEEGVSSCNDRVPTCEDGGSNSKFRPLRLSVDGSVLKGKLVFEKPQTPRDGVFDGSSTPSASGPRRAPSRPSSTTKVGFSVDMGVQPQTEWYQSDEYCGYGLPVTEQFNKPPVIRSQSRFPAQDDGRTVMTSDLQDTTQTRVPAGRSGSDTVSGGILDTTIGESVQAGGNAKAEVELSTGGGMKFGLGFASHSTTLTMDSRLQVDESWRQRLDIVNTVKTVMQVGCTDRARFASAFGGLQIDADLFQLGACTVVSASSETQQLTASINDSSDDGTSQVIPGGSDSSPCSSPSVSTISIDQNATAVASDKRSTLSDYGEVSVTSATSHPESDISALAKVPLYRLYAPSLPDHFYTTNAAERDACAGYGYTLESTAAQVLASPSPEGYSIPFFRIYRNKEHFYTADVVEKQRVVGWAGTRDEGIAGYVYPDRCVGTVPLYRLYNPGSDDHFYTTSAPEKEVCTKSGQWNDEGVACYVYP